MNMLLAFAPFAAFAVLEPRTGLHAALVVATLVAALLMLRDRVMRHRSLKALEVGSLALFGALALVSRLPWFGLSIVGVRLCVDLGLLLVIVFGLLIGQPFTMQYAVERVSPGVATTPQFRAINVMLSSAWALVFVVIVAADLAMLYVAGFTPLLGTIAIVAALGAGALLSAWIPRRVARTRR